LTKPARRPAVRQVLLAIQTEQILVAVILALERHQSPTVRQASLQTKTKLPLTNEEDIDRYLSGLKQQLLKLLDGGNSVMIVK